MKKEIKEWFARGKEDLLFAEAGFKESGLASQACFLSHQAIEKFLKGYLLFKKGNFPKTHDLLFLLDLIAKEEKEFKKISEKVRILNGYYIPTRYPGGEISVFSSKEARRALKVAKEIIEFIEAKLKSYK